MSAFSFLQTRKKAIDLSPYLRKICDLTVPNRGGTSEQPRTEDRYNRTLPVLLCPWNGGKPQPSQAKFALTKDISDRGISIVSPSQSDGELIVAFSSPDVSGEPWFFIGEVRRSCAIGGGYWAAGIELSELVTATHRQALQVLHSLTKQLCPE